MNAATLINAKVLEHKSWISGADEKGRAVSGHFESVDKGNSAGTGASAYNASGEAYRNIFTNGYHFCSIANHSQQSLVYTIDWTLCANSTYCSHNQQRILVNANGYYSDSARSSLTCSFSYPGSYGLEAKTDVTGPEFSHARGTATIQVR